MKKMGATEELVDFCSSLTYKDFPPEVIDKVKYHALDFMGVAARGSLVESSKVMFGLIKDMGSDPKGSVVIGTDMRALCQYAALANGTSSHSLDMDDVSNEASVHPAVVIFPAAFAAGELAGCDGKKFTEGVLLGYEVMVRLGIAQNPMSLYARGFYPTAICGIFGAAVAASKILDLNKEQMLSALGIAGSQAAGIMEFMNSGGWTHRMHTGWAAHNGILAALLAERGFKGPSAIIEGRYGFLRCYSDGSDLSKVLANLGDSYEITKISVKPYACCRYEHGSIDGILRIMKDHNLKAAEVKDVILGILKAGWGIIAEPIELKRNPKTVVDAIASMPFGAAVAILYGKASVDEYTQENVDSPKIKELMNKVSCVQDPELERVFPKQWPATVEIVTKDGRRFSTRIDYPKGDPENPFSWEELIDKYNDLSSLVYSQGRRNEILRRLKALEDEKKMADFCSLLLTNT